MNDFDNDLRNEVANWTKVIKINPNDVNAYKERGDIRSQLQDSQGAIEDYNQAIRINKMMLMPIFCEVMNAGK